MIPLSVGGPGRPLRQVLAVGAHSDDIEIGCGGTLLRLADEHPRVRFLWLVLSGDERRMDEAERSAAAFLPDSDRVEVVTAGFRDGFLPHVAVQVKELFEGLKAEAEPDLILTHQRNDLHQDHRLACELALQTFRDHLILEYEVPKYDGDMGAPNAFVPLTEAAVQRKVGHLMTHFGSQRSKRWFTEDLFRALMRLRGMESAAPSGFAEAFYARKLVLA